jgi:hypothetical protein
LPARSKADAGGERVWRRLRQIKKSTFFGAFFQTKNCFLGNSQATKKRKIILKSNKKERTSFCEQKEAKKL